ncbi:hypothetical protein EG329_000714 [Mollisiaceae sp. DMI_Dod_QoI]|nr:hypothetical protein EG329_000714 [Helotiales sp. DMI_Dod_QoI]
MLFHEIVLKFDPSKPIVNDIWQALLHRDDVLLAENGEQLNNTPLRKLSYNDISSLNLDAKVIRLRSKLVERHSDIPSAAMTHARIENDKPPTIPSVPSSIPASNGNMSNPVTGDSQPPSTRNDQLETPEGNAESSQQSASPVKKRLGRPPKKRDDAVPSSSPQQQITPVKKRLGRPPKIRDAIPQSPPPHQQPADERHPDAKAESSATLPDIPRLRPRRNSNNTTVAGDEILRRHQRRNSGVKTSTEETTTQVEENDERPIRTAKFTSNDELERQEGVSRAYINLPGTENPGETSSSFGRSCIAVFKSPQLKSPDFLEKHKGSWVLPFAEAMQRDLDFVEENTKPPKRDQRSRSYKKREGKSRAEKKIKEAVSTPLVSAEAVQRSKQTPQLPPPSNPQTYQGKGSEHHDPTSIRARSPATPLLSQNSENRNELIDTTRPSMTVTSSRPTASTFSTEPPTQIVSQISSPSQAPENIQDVPFSQGSRPALFSQAPRILDSSSQAQIHPVSARYTLPTQRNNLSATSPQQIHGVSSSNNEAPMLQIRESVERSNDRRSSTPRRAMTPQISPPPSSVSVPTRQSMVPAWPPSVLNQENSRAAVSLDTGGALSPRMRYELPKWLTEKVDLATKVYNFGKTKPYSSPYGSLPYWGFPDPNMSRHAQQVPTMQNLGPLQPSQPSYASPYQESEERRPSLLQPQPTQSTTPGNLSSAQSSVNAQVDTTQKTLSDRPVQFVPVNAVPSHSGYSPNLPSWNAPPTVPPVNPPQGGYSPFPPPMDTPMAFPPVVPAHGGYSQYPPPWSTPGANASVAPAYGGHSPYPPPLDTLAKIPTASSNNNSKKPPRQRKRKLSTDAEIQNDPQSQEGGLPKPKVQRRRKSQNPSHAQAAAEDTAAEKALTELLRTAEHIAVPNGRERLPCVFHDCVGNLILSEDKSTLEFFSTVQHPPELPLLRLAVAQISDHPITSVRGSTPMQLRIKVKDLDDEKTNNIHSFVYANSTPSFEAASNFRQKIIVAMIAESVRIGEHYQRPVEAEEQINKPYHCELCNARFKVKLGLEYHLTKSKTTCNPNFDPTTKPTKPGPRPKPKGSKEPRTPRKPKKPVPAPDGHDDDSNSGSSSEDSIIEWAKRTSGLSTGKANGTPQRKPARVYKALNRESEVLQEILLNIAAISEAAPDDLEILVPLASSPSTLPSLTDLAREILSTGVLTESVCKKMIMALIHANSDMFPAGKSLWMACVGLWLKMHPNTEALPRSTLCSKSLDDLVDENKLQISNFSFVDRQSRHITRSLVFVPGTDVTGLRSKMLKNLMAESHPIAYIPSHLAPPYMVLDRLHALVRRAIVGPVLQEVESEEDEDLVDFNINSPDSAPEEELLEDDEFVEDEFGSENDSETDLDNVEMDERAQQRRPRQQKSAMFPGKRYRDPETNARIGDSLRRRWKDVRAGRVKNAVYSSRNVSPAAPKPHWRPKPLVVQSVSRTWPSTPSFIPNPETGAWNIVSPTPVRVKRGPKAGKKWPFIPRLPEPITFMQAMDGSWSVRPFGHGVKPIYSRPARRSDGNPNLQAYLRKIEAGHRPIIYPTKNRLFLPHPPSKQFLAKLAKSPSDLTPNVRPAAEPKRKLIKAPVSRETASRLRREEFIARTKASRNNSDAVSSGYRRNSKFQDQDAPLPEPKKLEPGAPKNPGLETVPPRFGLNSSIYKGPDVNTLDFPKKYFTVFYTQQKIVGEDVDGPMESSWTLRELHTADNGYQIQWDDAFAFTSETLPYLDLIDDDDIPPQVPQPQQETISPLLAKRLRKLPGRDIKRPSWTEIMNCTRAQLAAPVDFEGLFEDPNEAAAEFKTQVSNLKGKSRKRQRRAETGMTQAEEIRFVIAVVIQSVLTGGRNQHIDWVLLSNIFPKWSINFLRACWKRISRTTMESTIDKLRRDFRHEYPIAYENEEVEPFNYDNLLGNDWHELIDWVHTYLAASLGDEPIFLPPTKEELYHSFDVEISAPADWRETWFNLAASKYKRIEVAAAEAKVKPIDQPLPEPGHRWLGRSWVRAVALTPEEDWDKEIAREMLEELGHYKVRRALAQLLGTKVLMHRAKNRVTPGRNYKSTDFFWNTLRKHMKESMFVEAVTYKRWMDEEFRSGTPCLAVDYFANEGTILCLTSLQAAGRISIQCVNIPMDKMGLVDKGYEMRDIPKEKLTFDMVVKPTESYIYEEENDDLAKILSSDPPSDPEWGKIPLWYGVTEVVILETWKRVLMAVCQVVALRAGINIASLARTFRPTLEDWELQLLMNWGVNVGLFERLSETVEGWTVTEWWWLVVGHVCTM